jgi:hypothetical protein
MLGVYKLLMTHILLRKAFAAQTDSDPLALAGLTALANQQRWQRREPCERGTIDQNLRENWQGRLSEYANRSVRWSLSRQNRIG